MRSGQALTKLVTRCSAYLERPLAVVFSYPYGPTKILVHTGWEPTFPTLRQLTDLLVRVVDNVPGPVVNSGPVALELVPLSSLTIREFSVNGARYFFIIGPPDGLERHEESPRWSFADTNVIPHVIAAMSLLIRGLNDKRELVLGRRYSEILKELSLSVSSSDISRQQWQLLVVSAVSRLLRGSRCRYLDSPNKSDFEGESHSQVVCVDRATEWKSKEYSAHHCVAASVLIDSTSPGGVVVPLRLPDNPAQAVVAQFQCPRHLGLSTYQQLDTLGRLGAVGISLRVHREKVDLAEVRQETLTSALDQAAEGIAIMDSELLLTYANRSFITMHGLDQSEVNQSDSRLLYPTSFQQDLSEELIDHAKRYGSVVGEVLRRRQDGTSFPAQVLLAPLVVGGDAQGWIMSVIDGSEQAQTMELLRHQALTDPLTSIYNRRALVDRLRDLLTSGEPTTLIGVLYVDIDHFKVVNDSFGHQIGDEFLRIISARITASLRPGDIAGRLGGDEFMVILPNLQSRSVAQRVADRMAHNLFDEPVIIGGHRLRCSASVGIAFGTPRITNADSVIQAADTAMYHSKRSLQPTSVYRARPHETIHRSFADQELGEALRVSLGRPERSGLSLSYAPIYDLKDGVVRGFEIVPRWNHPIVGTVAWDKIDALATATRLVGPLTEWLVDAVAMDFEHFHAQFGEQLVAMNFGVPILGGLLGERSVLKSVTNALRTHSPKQSFVLEISEGALAGIDPAESLAALRFCVKEGFVIALDGFGEQAPLPTLLEAPIAILKITPTSDWMSWSSSSRYLRACVALAKELGVDVVAKRVDTASDFKTVEPHVRYIQGGVIGSPGPQADVSAVLHNPLRLHEPQGPLADHRRC